MKPFERKRLTPFITPTKFDPGQVILTEGDAADDGMYFVKEGAATVTIAGVRETRVYEKGDYFGELALLMGSARAATVTAGDSGATCYCLSADHFRTVPKYVRLSFMKHAAFAYAKKVSSGDRGLGQAGAPSSVAAKSESELRRYIESTVLKGKRMRPPSQRNLLDDGMNSSDSSSDSDYDDPPPESPVSAAMPSPNAMAQRGGQMQKRTKSVTFGPVVESDGHESRGRAGDKQRRGGEQTPSTHPPSAPVQPAPLLRPNTQEPRKRSSGCCGRPPRGS